MLRGRHRSATRAVPPRRRGPTQGLVVQESKRQAPGAPPWAGPRSARRLAVPGAGAGEPVRSVLVHPRLRPPQLRVPRTAAKRHRQPRPGAPPGSAATALDGSRRRHPGGRRRGWHRAVRPEPPPGAAGRADCRLVRPRRSDPTGPRPKPPRQPVSTAWKRLPAVTISPVRRAVACTRRVRLSRTARRWSRSSTARDRLVLAESRRC